MPGRAREYCSKPTVAESEPGMREHHAWFGSGLSTIDALCVWSTEQKPQLELDNRGSLTGDFTASSVTRRRGSVFNTPEISEQVEALKLRISDRTRPAR